MRDPVWQSHRAQLPWAHLKKGKGTPFTATCGTRPGRCAWDVTPDDMPCPRGWQLGAGQGAGSLTGSGKPCPALPTSHARVCGT